MAQREIGEAAGIGGEEVAHVDLFDRALMGPEGLKGDVAFGGHGVIFPCLRAACGGEGCGAAEPTPGPALAIRTP